MQNRNLQSAIVLSVFLITGCSGESELPVSKVIEGVTEQEQEPAKQTETQEQPKPVLDFDAQTQLDLDFIKQHMKIGLTKEQVLKWFGEPASTGVHALNSNLNWRYDFVGSKGYEYIPEDRDLGIVTFDAEGLRKGDMRLHLFVGWSEDEQTVTDYGIKYRNQQGYIFDYIVDRNGEVIYDTNEWAILK